MMELNSLIIPGQTQEGGSWSIVSTPGGSNPAVLTGSIFDATNADPGVYEIQYLLSGVPDGCLEFDIKLITVSAPANPGAPLESVIICAGEDTTIVLRDLIEGGDSGGQWVETSLVSSLAGFDAVNGQFNTAIEIPGDYSFEYIVSGTGPCSDAFTTVEVIIEDVPVADAGADVVITCDQPSVMIGGSSSSQGPEFIYLWTTSDGLLTDYVSPETIVRDEGTYTLIVTNTETGCESYDDVVVGVDGDIPKGVEYDVTFPLCNGDPAAAIRILDVSGGMPPYTYALNGGTPTGNPDFTNLLPGDYVLTTIDALGCAYESFINIPDPSFLEGEITGQLLVQRGDETSLSYSLTTGVADSVIWYDSDGNVLCVNCDTLTFQAISNIDIVLVIFDKNSCSIQLIASIEVVVDRNLFVPNVFTPNDDGINDFITVYGEIGMRIKSLAIFSRWGELVFEVNNVAASDPELGWHGRFGDSDEELMPGVYVYHAMVVYIDGSEETRIGDITLIR